MDIDYYRSRRTVAESIELEGLGLHSGASVSLRINPAEPGRGIVFVRTDRDDQPEVPARYDSIVDSHRNTTIGSDDVKIKTVEHLLSAFYGLGITDTEVELDGPEVPVVDGSAQPFVEAIDDAGIDELNENRPVHRVENNTVVTAGDSSLVLAPSPSPRIDYTISYDNPAINDQFESFKLTPETYRETISPARTYGFEEEVEQLLEEGLAQGGSLDNALIVDEEGNFPGDEPRLEKEFVKHKMLDLLGDLALSGHFIAGRVIGVMGSHELNASLLSEMNLKDPAESIASPSDNVRESGSAMPLDIQEIKKVLPHRYPFLLIDRIVSIDYEEATAVGYKNVTINEEYFQGHFPDDPVMPGVLMVEAMAQLGAACILGKPQYEGKNSYFMGLDDVKWRKPVRPGDRVYFQIEGQRMRSRYGVVDGQAFVDDELAAEATYKFAIVDE